MRIYTVTVNEISYPNVHAEDGLNLLEYYIGETSLNLADIECAPVGSKWERDGIVLEVQENG